MGLEIVLAVCLFWQVNAQGQGDIRLAGTGHTATSGRVEVFINGLWGTVCKNAFDLKDALVVCRQLGLNTDWPAVSTFGAGSGPIWFNTVSCDGSEQRLVHCMSGNWNTSSCNHSHDVGVICSITNPAQNTSSTVASVVPGSGIFVYFLSSVLINRLNMFHLYHG